MKPFLKWPGGKYRLAERIKSSLPPGKRLIEPFIGSGAIFLNTDYPHYLLSDINTDLINLYNIIHQNGLEFINYSKSFFIRRNNNEKKYYQFRDEFNQTDDIIRKSALFIYLNKHGYNGLCRYNLKGEFNVPFGLYASPYFPEKELHFFFEKSRLAIFKCADFQDIMKEAKSGDVIYCDPPYVPLSSTANFTTYGRGGFQLTQQIQLAELAEQLSKRGISVLISNHYTSFTKQAYQNSTIETFEVRRFISCQSHNRGKAIEMLAYYPPK